MTHLSNDKDVSQSGGEDMPIAVLHVDNVEGSLMPLPKAHELSNTMIYTKSIF